MFERSFDAETLGLIRRLTPALQLVRDLERTLMYLLAERVAVDGEWRACIPRFGCGLPVQCTPSPKIVDAVKHLVETRLGGGASLQR